MLRLSPQSAATVTGAVVGDGRWAFSKSTNHVFISINWKLPNISQRRGCDPVCESTNLQNLNSVIAGIFVRGDTERCFTGLLICAWQTSILERSAYRRNRIPTGFRRSAQGCEERATLGQRPE